MAPGHATPAGTSPTASIPPTTPRCRRGSARHRRPGLVRQEICDFLLDGKLVCMASEPVCVLGTIVGLEHTSYGKCGPDAIDNDFSFNLLLAPFRPTDLRRYAVASVNQHIIFRHVAKHAPQGDLIEVGPGG